MKTKLPKEVLEQMNREGWATLEQQKQFWIDKEAESNNDALRQAALSSKSTSEFIYKIQRNTPESGRGGLLAALYNWEYSTPENIKRFKLSGWFSIANKYWQEFACPQSVEANTATPSTKPAEAVSDNATNETREVWFCNYETIEAARKVADKMNDLAKQMRKLHDDQPAHVREDFGYGTMNCGLYSYSAGPPMKMHKDITDEWGGLYRTLRASQDEQSTTADPKPETDDLSRTEATAQWFDGLADTYWSLRDEGRNPDGSGESYAERNI